MVNRIPTYFISHGGGPWPWIPEMADGMSTLRRSLEDIPRQLGRKPRAVLVASGHWESSQFALMASPKPPMVYDYSGFPPHTYLIHYDAPGDPELARRGKALLEGAGIAARLDPEQGFDHGTFAPLAMMYPDADVPIVQLSLKHGYDPAAHLAAGRALAPLRDEEVLIVGSGLSYHNLRRMGPVAMDPSKAFDDWLQQTLIGSSPAERTARLQAWAQAPAAREAHPREDHLLPLMIAAGAAEQEPATLVYHEEHFFGGVTASSFRFG